MPTMHTIEEHEAQQVKPYIDASIQNLSTVVSKNGAKNFMPCRLDDIKEMNTLGTWTGDSYTFRGITYTFEVNSSGYVKHINANGTVDANNDSGLTITKSYPKENYVGKILSGSTGGTPVTYMINYIYRNSADAWIAQGNLTDGEMTILDSANAVYMRFAVTCVHGNTISNQKFYPMIRLASDTDPTYEPYAKTNQQLTTEVQNLSTVISKNGAKNLLPFDLAKAKATNTAGTWSGNAYTHLGVTFTPELDSEGRLLYVNVNGTNTSSTANAYLSFCDRETNGFSLPSASYKLTGCPSGGSGSTYNCYVTNGTEWDTDYGEGIDFTANSNNERWNFVVVAGKGTTVSNKKFYPMIRLASDTDPTYEPWAMTNRELTAKATPQFGDITCAGVTWSAADSHYAARYGDIVEIVMDFTVGNEDIPAWSYDNTHFVMPDFMKTNKTVNQVIYLEIRNTTDSTFEFVSSLIRMSSDHYFGAGTTFKANKRYMVHGIAVMRP